MKVHLVLAALGAIVAATLLPASVGRADVRVVPTVMFVTQPPFGGDFTSVNATFGNHEANTGSTPRGGDLYIRYSDGTLRNLTAEAGYGLQVHQEISVREPSVHWSGTKALFSMVVGGTVQNDYSPVYWQIYEVTGIGQGQTVQITRLPQPSNSNNVSPFYGTTDRIFFTSDRPRNGDQSLYPQLDEYESQPTNTGIWSMNADGTNLRLLDHTVSGAFTPIVASDGRIIFTRWDHLQRDQQSDEGTLTYGAFNYVRESSAVVTTNSTEIFPELRTVPAGNYYHGHTFNQFFPWQVNEDGTGLETVNHVGRHELESYFDSAHDGLPEFIAADGRRTAFNMLQLKESPSQAGYFYATKSQEFGTHAMGQIVALNGNEAINADNMQVDYISDPASFDAYDSGQTPPPGFPGHFRNPTPLTDGTLIAVHASSAFRDHTTSGQLSSLYDCKLVKMQQSGQYMVAGARLITNPINKTISYWDNYSYSQVSYSGPMWELDPVEVRSRPRPAARTSVLPSIENQILLDELGGQPAVDRFKNYLASHNLALIVSRNVTRRADRQQDFNLKIFNSTTQTAEPGSVPVEVRWAQFFQGDLVRSYSNYHGGRRPIAQVMHDGNNRVVAGAPPGSVELGTDGSMAALVPARRALTWQLAQNNGTASVRERYWLTFAAGEMRSCTNCHGINTVDTVLGLPAPTNPPEALRTLVRWYRDNSFNGTVGDTVGVFVPSSSTYFLRNSHQPGAADAAYSYGPANAGWVPLSGDWNGDGVDSPGLYDPQTGNFFLKNANAGGAADYAFQYGGGNSGATPIVGDWDNDGTDTVGLYFASTGSFFLRNSNSSGAAERVFGYGPAGAVPVVGDWDGDGGDSIGVYIPSTGTWFLRNSNSPGAADIAFSYGPANAGWVAMVGDWNNDNVDTVGLYNASTGFFFLRDSNTPGAANLVFGFGPTNVAMPVKGDWNGG